MTSVVRFEEWQEPTGTTAATVDSSGNVSFNNNVTATGNLYANGSDIQLVTICRDSYSVASGTNIDIVFSTELVDIGGWHSGSSKDITPDVDGIYLITANGQYINSTNRSLIELKLDGANIAASDDNSGGYDHSLAIHYPVNAGQSISMICWQNSGSTVTPTFTLGVQLVRAL